VVQPGVALSVAHEQQVLQRVVEHDGMPRELRIGKLHAPRQAGDAADDLAVDEVADAAEPHQQGAGNHERVGELEKRLATKAREERGTDRCSRQQPVCGHPSEPVGRDERRVLAIKRPLVKRHLDQAPADEHAHGEPQAQ